MSLALKNERFVIFFYREQENVNSEKNIYSGSVAEANKPVIVIGVRDLLVNIEALARHNKKFSVYCLGECVGDFS
jgi:hypothetical protein